MHNWSVWHIRRYDSLSEHASTGNHRLMRFVGARTRYSWHRLAFHGNHERQMSMRVCVLTFGGATRRVSIEPGQGTLTEWARYRSRREYSPKRTYDEPKKQLWTRVARNKWLRSSASGLFLSSPLLPLFDLADSLWSVFQNRAIRSQYRDTFSFCTIASIVRSTYRVPFRSFGFSDFSTVSWLDCLLFSTAVFWKLVPTI